MRKRQHIIYWLAAFAAALILMIWFGGKLLRMEFSIDDFSATVLSMASSRNVDIKRVVSEYYAYVILVCPLLIYAGQRIFAATGLSGWFGKWQTLVQPSVLAAGKGTIPFRLFFLLLLAGAVHAVVFARLGQPILNDSLGCLLCMGICLLFSCWLGYRYRIPQLAVRFFTFGSAAVFALYLPLALFLGGRFPVGTGWILYMLLSMIVFGSLAAVHDPRAEDMQQEMYASRPFFVVFAIMPLVLEMFFVLWARQIEYEPAWLWGILAIAALFWGHHRWRQFSDTGGCGISVYLLTLLGTIWFSLHGIFGRLMAGDFFEGANHGLAIAAFFADGSLPILTNFNAHMLSNVLGGLLYGVLSQDTMTALYLPYGYMQGYIGAAACFLLLRYFLEEETAFLFVLLCPLFLNLSLLYIGMVMILYFVFWQRHSGWGWDILAGCLVAISCLYRLDLGVAYGGAFALCGSYWLLSAGSYRHWWRFWAAQLIVGAVAAVLFGLLCWQQNVIPGDVVQKFLYAALSDQNWAYGILGKPAEVMVIYILLPLFLAGMLVACFIASRRKDYDVRLWMLLFLGAAWVCYMPRGLVRHTMAEQCMVPYSLPLLIIGLFVAWKYSAKAGTWMLLLLYMGAALFLPLNSFRVPLDEQLQITEPLSFAGMAIDNMPLQQACIAAKSKAVKLPSREQQTIEELRAFLDGVLAPDETYIDFTNQSLLYALVGRQNPVYVNQSPGLVNGIGGQQEFLQEVSKAKAPLVLLPYVQQPEDMAKGSFCALDGILNMDRYFLITEYIGRHYRPLCAVDRFAVWCRKEDYDRLAASVAAPVLSGYDYNISLYHHHDLGMIPFLLGKNVQQAETAELPLSGAATGKILQAWAGKPCFLEMEVEAVVDGTMGISLTGEGSIPLTYRFKVCSGRHVYRIRCSSDILWYSGRLTSVRAEMDSGSQLHSLHLRSAE